MEFLFRLIDLYINPLIYVIFSLALIYFVWGIYRYWIGNEGAENRLQGARHILWALVGMVIMISVFALMNFIQNSLGVESGDRPVTLPN